jgi:hypothetical protein
MRVTAAARADRPRSRCSPGASRRAGGRKDDDREADVAKNEADEVARKGGGEAPESDGDEDDGV